MEEKKEEKKEENDFELPDKDEDSTLNVCDLEPECESCQ